MEKSQLEIIAEHLKDSGALSQYVGEAAPPEHETAYALCDIIESAAKLVDEIFPKLLQPSDGEIYRNALEEFREEMRHISYHIRESQYLSVVIDTVAS